MTYNKDQRSTLLRIAYESIAHGMQSGDPLVPKVEDYAPSLREQRATFTTLHLDGRLRGCIGVMEAHRPLVVDVAWTAYGAAFQDPRFSPLSPAELNKAEISLSVLSPLEEVHFSSEAEFLAMMRPRVDGFLLRDKGHSGVFLPIVWEELSTPEEFLFHLKMKAGLPGDYWSKTIRIWRYESEKIEPEKITAA